MTRFTPARVLAFAAIAALTVFVVAQDRIVTSGVGRYIDLKRTQLAGRGPDVAIADVMQPAVRRSVRFGLILAGAVFFAGCGVAALRSRRSSGR